MTEPEILAEWRERYPLAFAADAILPLAIGIHEELLAQGYSHETIRAALGQYVQTPAYLQALAAGKPRVDLSGQAVGTVTAAHREKARAKLAPPIAKRPGLNLIGEPGQIVPLARTAFRIAPESIQTVLELNSAETKALAVIVQAGDQRYSARLSSINFRQAVTAYRSEGDAVVCLCGRLAGHRLRAAGMRVLTPEASLKFVPMPLERPKPPAKTPKAPKERAPKPAKKPRRRIPQAPTIMVKKKRTFLPPSDMERPGDQETAQPSRSPTILVKKSRGLPPRPDESSPEFAPAKPSPGPTITLKKSRVLPPRPDESAPELAPAKPSSGSTITLKKSRAIKPPSDES